MSAPKPPTGSFPALRANSYRDLWCGQVLADRVGSTARLAGWVHRRRDHGGLVFVDLRDRTGLVQLVLDPADSPEAHELSGRLRAEDVISVSGEVVRRSPETVNPALPTGEVEVRVREAKLLADAETPPFGVESFAGEVGEEMRLRYRYLDLRRERMRTAIELRHHVAAAIRDFLRDDGFIEIETPMLSRSTPEGARDFLVPWRGDPGTFFALPQSPQLFKQLLMVAGFERYFQIVRCFRDEDLRADRQPDFTQLDIEMSFVETEDVLDVNERLLVAVFERVGGPSLAPPLPRLPYDEAIARYGTDRPDLRFGLELVDLSDLLADTEFKVFRGAIEAGGVVKGLNAGARDLPRSALDGLIERAQELGAKGLVWAFREGEGWRSPTAKFLSAAELRALNERLGAGEGDLLLVVADRPALANAVLARLRLELGERFGLIDEGADELCWIVDWPLFEWSEEEGRWDPLHHPFTSPAGEFDPARAGEARALAYDLVWNGQEMGGGSIRIADPELQLRVLEAIGIGEAEARERFGFLLDALRYGAPPHGGIAYGLDRIVQRLVGAESIRDVIAFPKSASGADPLTGAPAPVDETQLRQLGLRLSGRRSV
jgi:aspartyl-tRNA synthetase